MVKKALNAMYGIKVKTTYEKAPNPKKHNYTVDKQDRVDICLSCTKPASQCKGSCFGKY